MLCILHKTISLLFECPFLCAGGCVCDRWGTGEGGESSVYRGASRRRSEARGRTLAATARPGALTTVPRLVRRCAQHLRGNSRIWPPARCRPALRATTPYLGRVRVALKHYSRYEHGFMNIAHPGEVQRDFAAFLLKNPTFYWSCLLVQ